MLKRPASLYHPGQRTRQWLKIRNIRTADVRVGGWLPGTGTRAHLAGSLLMGLPRPGGLDFAGPLPSAITRHARWARPVITAEVTYLERTPSGRLRQPVWRGLRPL